jgi:hypothetical protein
MHCADIPHSLSSNVGEQQMERLPVGSDFSRSAGRAPTAGEYVRRRVAPRGRLAVDPI